MQERPKTVIKYCEPAGDYLVMQVNKQTGDANEWVRFWDASVAVAYGKAEHELGNDHMAIPALGGAQAELWLVTQRAHDPSLVEQANAVLESLKKLAKDFPSP
jgi:hypothetical protein